MGWFGALHWLVARRLRSSWPLLLITSFGILAAVTMMSVGVIYTRALAEGGLKHMLASTSPRVLNIHLITQNRPLGPADYQALRSTVEEIAQARMGFMLRAMERYGFSQGNTRMMRPSAEGPAQGAPALDAPTGRPFFLTGFQDHSEIVAGNWPQSGPALHEKGVELEAVMGERAAKSMALDVGSRVVLVPFLTDPEERIGITIVGLAVPTDPGEEYWMNSPLNFFDVVDTDDRIIVPFYVTEESFFGGMGTKYPSLVGDFTWWLFLDTSMMNASNVVSTREALRGLESDVNQKFPRTLVLSGLKVTIKDFRRELLLAQVPIFLFLSLVVLVILYFLALVMGLLAGARYDEAALLRSRGASILQVTGLLVFVEGIVALAAMIAGPFLALAIVRYLLLSTINPIGDAETTLPVGISLDMFVMGAIGGVLALLVLVGSSINRARPSMVESLRDRARPPTLPLLQRYYIDLVVLAAVVFVLWQIQGREGFVVRDLATKDVKVDLVLLVGPILVLLGVAVVVMRVLPWLVRIMAWMGERVAPAWAAFALARLARDPIPYGALVIILMLSAALGVFGATFQATLSLSQTEQALYRAGGEVVIGGPNLSRSDVDKLADTPFIRSFTPVVRVSASLLDWLPGTSVTLLAVDPEAMVDIVWFREDFAEESLAGLMATLRPLSFSPAGTDEDALGIGLPNDAESLGVWLNLSGLHENTPLPGFNFWARIVDSRGRMHNIFMGEITRPSPNTPGGLGQNTPAGQDGSWTLFEAEIPEVVVAQGEQIRLVTLYFSRKSFSRIPPGRIMMDDITVKSASGPPEGLVVEGYEGPGRWVPLVNRGQVLDQVEYTPQAARSGTRGLVFSWGEQFGESPRGILMPGGSFPLPAVGGPDFNIGDIIRVKVQGHLFPIIIRETTNFFPSVDPTNKNFLILPIEQYRQYVRRAYNVNIDDPGAFWLSLVPGVDREQVLTSVAERFGSFASYRDRNVLVETAQRNPLTGGGWNGLTILSLSAITLAVLLTLIIHAVVAIHTGRVDLTVARTLGFSRVQIFLSLALERVMVAAIGLGVGSAVGVWLGRWVLGFLDITSRGRPVVPPMVLVVQEWLVALVLFGLVAASLLAILVAAVSAHRLRLADVLRTGE
ncbi:MAG: ABC transporter permease [Chloroflexi bacterium]|nr:ABC transporter permease [Chloroflexota bacterium]